VQDVLPSPEKEVSRRGGAEKTDRDRPKMGERSKQESKRGSLSWRKMIRTN